MHTLHRIAFGIKAIHHDFHCGNIYEVCMGLPLYPDFAHEEFLAVKICQGLRPKSSYKIP